MLTTNNEIVDLARIQLQRNHSRIEQAMEIVTSLSRECGRILEMVRAIEGDNSLFPNRTDTLLHDFIRETCPKAGENYLRSLQSELVWLDTEVAQALKTSDDEKLFYPITEEEKETVHRIRAGEAKVIAAAKPSDSGALKDNGKRKALGRGLNDIEGKKK